MPIITDLTQNADINPVHMGVVIIVTAAFGLITPPYGLALLNGVEICWCAFRQGDVRIAADLRRLFRRYRVLYFFPRYRAVAAQAAAAESVGCFKNPSGAGYICP